MERRATAIVLMLSLVALFLLGTDAFAGRPPPPPRVDAFAGRPPPPRVDAFAGGPPPPRGADDIIRLPGDAAMEETKPCCDDARCSKGGLCYCKDLVEECALTCKNCKAVDGTDPARYMCRDASWGGRPPKCT